MFYFTFTGELLKWWFHDSIWILLRAVLLFLAALYTQISYINTFTHININLPASRWCNSCCNLCYFLLLLLMFWRANICFICQFCWPFTSGHRHGHYKSIFYFGNILWAWIVGCVDISRHLKQFLQNKCIWLFGLFLLSL